MTFTSTSVGFYFYLQFLDNAAQECEWQKGKSERINYSMFGIAYFYATCTISAE